MTFVKCSEHNKPGIAGPITEEDSGNRGVRWKRMDGFGHMTDAEVAAYKLARPDRYMHDILNALAARIDALEVK